MLGHFPGEESRRMRADNNHTGVPIVSGLSKLLGASGIATFLVGSNGRFRLTVDGGDTCRSKAQSDGHMGKLAGANWLGQIGWPLEAVLVISNGAVSSGATINGASAGIAGIQAAGT
jgi:hypothetical protein